MIRKCDRRGSSARRAHVLRHFAWFKFIGALIVCVLGTSPALAESVLLVVQGGIDQDPAPLELRLRSEFTSEGLEVVTASSRSQQNLIDLEGLARRTGTIAGLSAFVDVQSIDGRLWVVDPASNVDLVRTFHVSRAESDPVTVFALRAVEALRGARLELEQQKRRWAGAATGVSGTNANGQSAALPDASTSSPNPVSTPPKTEIRQAPAPANKVAPPSERQKPRDTRQAATDGGRPWMLAASGILARDLNGLGYAPGPGLELRRRLLPNWSWGLAFAGPLFTNVFSPVPKPGSTVSVNQEWLEAQVRWTAIAGRTAAVELVAVSGLSRFAAKGQAAPPVGRSASCFGWNIGGGVGLSTPVTEWFVVALDLQWFRRVPAPVIEIDR